MARKLIDRALRMGEAGQFKRYEKQVERINAIEPEMELLEDSEILEEANALRERARNGETLDDLMFEAFALCREAGKRALSMRHFDVQLIGGMVLHSGSIAEMKTGEGKTLVATLPVFLNSLAGESVHLVTVNDYLARRDAEWMGPIYDMLGVKVGVIQNMQSFADKQVAYKADVTYGTNSEFGFDYLRDNMAGALEEVVQRGHPFGIVDEVDNILIDEARTPLIISGAPEAAADYYRQFARLAPMMEGVPKSDAKTRLELQMEKDQEPEYDYEYDEKHKTVAPTERGVAKAEKFIGVENLYLAEHGNLVNHLIQALKAEALYKRDTEYAVIEGEVLIIDEFTGRIMEGRRWSEGLHQAVEAKENVGVREENQTLATITLQNYFRMYDKLGGMTGTALTEAQEFMKIYEPPVVDIPTNQPMVRADQNDQIYKTKDGKWEAVAEEIAARHEKGQPILVGTISVEVSESLSDSLKKRGVKHVVLTAKPRRRERGGDDRGGGRHRRRGRSNEYGRPRSRIELGGNRSTWRISRCKAGRRAGRRRMGRDLPRHVPAHRGAGKGGARARAGDGRPVHPRHRAPRVAPPRNQLRGRSGRQGEPGEPRSTRPRRTTCCACSPATDRPHSRPAGPHRRGRGEQPIEAKTLSRRSRTPRRRSSSRTS